MIPTPLIAPHSSINIKTDRRDFYDRCSRKELASFIKSRTGHKVLPIYMSKQLRGRLLALDRNATFRFLDLPAELRLEIEEELLGHNRPTKKLHWQILGVSQMINKEASPIFREAVNGGKIHLVRIRSNKIHGDDSIATCSRTFCRGASVLPFTTIQTGNSNARPPSPNGRTCKELAAMPPVSDEARYMVINIDFESPCQGDGCEPDQFKPDELIYRHLYLLATQIRTSNIEKVSLRIITGKHILAEEGVWKMLWPLTRLGRRVQITINGISNQNFRDLNKEQVRCSYAYTALSEVQYIKDEAQRLAEKVRQAGLSNTGVMFLPILIEATLEKRSLGFCPLSCDEGVKVSIRQMQDILGCQKWMSLRRQAEQILVEAGET